MSVVNVLVDLLVRVTIFERYSKHMFDVFQKKPEIARNQYLIIRTFECIFETSVRFPLPAEVETEPQNVRSHREY